MRAKWMCMMLGLFTLSVIACGQEEPIALVGCTGLPQQNVVVEVRDSLTGAYIATGATGTLRLGSEVTHLVASPTGIHLLEPALKERAGLYTLTVEKPGYVTKEIQVEVKWIAQCNTVQTAQVVVQLKPTT